MLTLARKQLKNKFTNLFRTRSAIINKARRMHHESAKEQEEIILKLKNELEAGINNREIDTVQEKITEIEELILTSLKKLEQVEETELLQEFDITKPLDEIIEWTQELLKHLSKHTDLEEVKKKTQLLYHELLELKRFENQALRNEYVVLLRQFEGETRQNDNFVITVDERRAASNALWNERSEMRKTTKVENEERHELHDMLAEMKSLPEHLSKDQAVHLLKQADEINDTTQELIIEFRKLLKDFLLVIRVLVHEWFEYLDQTDIVIRKADEELHEKHFPTKIDSAVHVSINTTKQKERELAKIVVNIARRIGRIENNA